MINLQLILHLIIKLVQPSTSAKYLGITIDNKLSFKQHIILLENRVARSVGIIAKASYYLHLVL